MSEIFLMVWAGIATCLAVYFQHKNNQLHHEMAVVISTMVMIAKGKATATFNNDRLSVSIEEGV